MTRTQRLAREDIIDEELNDMTKKVSLVGYDRRRVE